VARLVGEVRLEQDILEPLLGLHVLDGPKQAVVAPLTMDGELTRRERDVLPATVLPGPDGEPDQLQAIEFATRESGAPRRRACRRERCDRSEPP
jgi:hypothetical protein